MPIATARRVYRLAYRDDQAAIVVVAAILAATLVAYLWVTAAVRSLAAAAFGGDALGELVGPALVALAATTTVAVLSIAELAALNQVVQVRATARLQPWLLDHVLRWPLGEHDHRSPGDLRDVIVNLTASATASVAALVKPAIALVQTLFVLVVMLTVDILLASVVIGTLALYTAFFVAIQRPLGKLQEQVTAAERAVSGRVDDVHRNADEIKRSALEDPLLDDFAATAEPWFVANRRYFRRINTLGFGGDLLALLLPAALLLAGSASGRTSEPATLVTVYLLALLLVGLFRSVQIASRASFAGADHWRVVFGLFDTPAEPTGGTPVTGSDIEWSGVTKTWRDRQVLDGVDLTIGHGEKCALVGRSGHGKTTALRMLVGLTDPDGGTVRVGGVDVTTAEPASLRSRVAVVTQDPYLFDATVAGNLDPSGGADPAEIAELLDVVGLGDAVAALPDGLETRTGAGGHDLSGGERARVALARALGRRPEILILDETFANLDSQTEERIVARLADRGRRLSRPRRQLDHAHRRHLPPPRARRSGARVGLVGHRAGRQGGARRPLRRRQEHRVGVAVGDAQPRVG